MLLIYTHQITLRIRYTFNLIFTSVLGIDFEITTDKEYFKKSQEAKISYSKNKIEDELFFQCDELLFETGIKPLSGWDLSASPSDKFAKSFFLDGRLESFLSPPPFPSGGLIGIALKVPL